MSQEQVPIQGWLSHYYSFSENQLFPSKDRIFNDPGGKRALKKHQ